MIYLGRCFSWYFRFDDKTKNLQESHITFPNDWRKSAVLYIELKEDGNFPKSWNDFNRILTSRYKRILYEK